MLRDRLHHDLGRAALLAVVLLAGAPAPARAGAAGDCCADLEARIAELEAMTARKGNREVSVTVSGWANEAVFAWDDGTQSGTYIGTNAVEQSRFRFVGEAKIDKDWSAGYLAEIGLVGHNSSQWNQDSARSASVNEFNRDDRVVVRKSNWYLKSKTLGQVALGLNAMATYHMLDDADPTLTRNVDDSEGAVVFLAAFRVRINGQFVKGLRWVDILRGFNNSTPGDSARRSIVRYDTPELFGFSAATTWGEDDIWDAMLNYKGDIGDFTLTGRAGYGHSNDPGNLMSVVTPYVSGGTPCISSATNLTSLPNFLCEWGGAAATVWHKPTGLFLYGGWGSMSVHTDHVFPRDTVLLPNSTTWFLQPGIEKQWLALGKTALFAEYRHDDPGSNPNRTVDGSVNFWQAGAVQRLENADMSLYMVYEYADGEVVGNAATAAAGAPVGTSKLDAFQELVVGAKINF
jgi:hypothetical protein